MVEANATKRFEVKKWNAVALWAWGKYLRMVTDYFTTEINIDSCAICRTHIYEACIDC